MAWIKSWTTLLLIVLAFISYFPWLAEGFSLTCPLVDRENTQTVVTCSGLASTETAYWKIEKDGAKLGAGNCPPLHVACETRWSSIIELSRPSSDVSTLTIKNTTRALFRGAFISCSAKVPPEIIKNMTHCHVDFMYRPTSVVITLNSQNGSLVVNESQKQDVEVVCRAEGRPTPNLQLIADSDREVATGGTVGDTETVLRHTLPAVRGEDSSNYSCLATDDLGQKASDSVVLYVQYPPKVKVGSFSKYRDGLPYIDYQGSQTNLTFDLLAYPVPDKVSYLHLGLDLAAQGGRPRLGVFRSAMQNLSCRNTSNLYKFTCDIIADDVTTNDIGFYNVTYENKMGRITITIRVDLYGVETADTTEVPRSDAQDEDGADDALSSGAGVGVGIAVGVACIVVVVILVLWRRKARMFNNTGSAGLPVTRPSSPEAMTEEEDKEAGEYSESGAAGPYEPLRPKNAGERSVCRDVHRQTENTR